MSSNIKSPKVMCAALLVGHGGPEKLVLRRDVPVPRTGKQEVLIEVSACGVNNSDLQVREGAYGSQEDPSAVSSFSPSLTFPRIQGADIVGRIAAVGEGVSEERVGERVMVDFNIYLCDDDSLAEVDYIGHGRDGGFAEVTIVTTDQARPVRSELSDLELATFCADYFGGERMLNRVNLQAGERVLISGASGGVGSAVIQLCCVRGAIPVALTSRSKLDAARAIGAAAVMARDEEDLAGSVLAAIDGQPIDVVVDLVGGPLFPVLLRVLKPEGRYVA